MLKNITIVVFHNTTHYWLQR